MSVNKKQAQAAFAVLTAVSEAIRTARQIPAGELYAVLMGRMDLAGFDKLVAILVGSGLVEKRGDLLRWIGPEIREVA